MVSLKSFISMRILAPFILLTTLVVLLVLNHYVPTMVMLIKSFNKASQPIIALSVSLIIFPFITVSAVENIVSKARNMGINVNTKLIKDYIDACFTVFLLALIEIVMLITYSFTSNFVIVYIAFAVLVTLIPVLGTLMFGLWQVIELLYRIVE